MCYCTYDSKLFVFQLENILCTHPLYSYGEQNICKTIQIMFYLVFYPTQLYLTELSYFTIREGKASSWIGTNPPNVHHTEAYLFDVGCGQNGDGEGSEVGVI